MRKKKNNTIGFAVLTFCLVLISAFCITGTVISQTKPLEAELINYYREQEKELVHRTREYLSQAGFPNSGVTLTSVIEVDGSREYTLTIHHGKINKMDENSKESLKEELASLVFVADNCIFYHEFLLTD